MSELKKMGAKIEEKADGFIVEEPTRLNGAVCESFNDHRIAMALTIAGLIAEGETQESPPLTYITDAECIDVSFPEFTKSIRNFCDKNTVSAES